MTEEQPKTVEPTSEKEEQNEKPIEPSEEKKRDNNRNSIRT